MNFVKEPLWACDNNYFKFNIFVIERRVYWSYKFGGSIFAPKHLIADNLVVDQNPHGCDQFVTTNCRAT